MGTLLLALVARSLVYLSAGGDTSRFVTPDSLAYVTLAVEFRTAYFDEESSLFTLGLFRTPAYPAFMALVFAPFKESLAAVVAAQIGLGLLTVWLTLLLGARLVGRPASWVAGLVVAIDPVSVLYPSLIQPETLFTVLLVGGVLAWVLAMDRASTGIAFAAGLLLGLAALARPIGLFLPLCMAPVIFLRRGGGSRFRLALCFLMGSAIPIGGWMAKNQVLTGSPVFTVVTDSSLLDYRAAGALAEDQGLSMEEARERVWRRFWSTVRPGMSVVELSRQQRTVAFEILGEHKAAAFRVAVHGVARFFTGTGLAALTTPRADAASNAYPGPWQVAAQSIQLLILAVIYGAVIRAVFLMLQRRQFFELALLLGVIGYLVILSAGPEAYTRFRFPAVPFLAILTGYGLSQRRAALEPPASLSPRVSTSLPS